MTKQTINIGAAANDRKGDSLRAAFTKVNANFDELYSLGVSSGTQDLEIDGGDASTITSTGDITVDGGGA